jgi:uncharacterized membrane protein
MFGRFGCVGSARTDVTIHDDKLKDPATMATTINSATAYFLIIIPLLSETVAHDTNQLQA